MGFSINYPHERMLDRFFYIREFLLQNRECNLVIEENAKGSSTCKVYITRGDENTYAVVVQEFDDTHCFEEATLAMLHASTVDEGLAYIDDILDGFKTSFIDGEYVWIPGRVDENVGPEDPDGGVDSTDCIDRLREVLTEEEFRGFCKGNAIRYIWEDVDFVRGNQYLDLL